MSSLSESTTVSKWSWFQHLGEEDNYKDDILDSFRICEGECSAIDGRDESEPFFPKIA